MQKKLIEKISSKASETNLDKYNLFIAKNKKGLS